ncbi:MAG: alpha/beta hydrolase, partial [Campylobacterota bacterium]|nr:alpha/beta hydrolase [Campylobacterota bacterium]
NDRVLILHGWGASDYPHWQAQLASHIAQNYGSVCFPKLKNFDAPTKEEWISEAKIILEEFKPNIVVTHSVASTLWFWLAQEDISTIEKLYLVAPPSQTCNIPELSTFFPCPTPSSLKAKEAMMIVSDNDPYITMNEAQSLADSLNIEMVTLENAGHINSDSGYGKWEWMEQKFNQK